MKKQFSMLMLVSVLTACNYHLRGTAEVPEVLRNVYVQNASLLLNNSFKDTLKVAGGALVDKPNQKGVIVHVLDEKFDRRSLSLTSTGKASEYELVYSLTFEVLTIEGKAVMQKQKIEIKRNYFNDQQDIMGKGTEETQIRKDMYDQAVRELMDRGRASVQGAPK
jgi:LPS-assembly lipoprotein